jgi:hypothetical protein
MRPKVLAAQAGIIEPLMPAERMLLVDLLTRVVEANEAHARPGAGRRPPRRKAPEPQPIGKAIARSP